MNTSTGSSLSDPTRGSSPGTNDDRWITYLRALRGRADRRAECSHRICRIGHQRFGDLRKSRRWYGSEADVPPWSAPYPLDPLGEVVAPSPAATERVSTVGAGRVGCRDPPP